MAKLSPIDEELNHLERDIRQLKVEYDQFFGGGRKRPPTEIEWRIELMVKRYAERGGELKAAQRFRYNNLTQTHAKYKDIFRKKMQQREEGRLPRHFGAAAKAIEAERAQKEAEARGAQNGETAAQTLMPFRVVCSDPEHEAEKVEQLYQVFLQAKKQVGEPTGKYTKSGFSEFVCKKTQYLQKENHCREVEYVIDLIEGQVKLKALVKT